MIELHEDGASPCSEVLTLRDYFAGQAMQSLILTKHYQNMATDNPAVLGEMFATLADEAYDYAIAMLEARPS
jgi:hypothetical protein